MPSSATAGRTAAYLASCPNHLGQAQGTCLADTPRPRRLQGVPQDWVRAAAIYYEAYQERNAEAMFNLGFMHEFGAGVPKDLPLARKFYLMTSHTMPDARYAVQVRGWLRVTAVTAVTAPAQAHLLVGPAGLQEGSVTVLAPLACRRAA
jgi:hypothetical protein